jgi:hypothetical protein
MNQIDREKLKCEGRRVLWSKNYTELAAAGRSGFYSAEVRPHHWPNTIMFRAYPHSGSVCTEFLGQSEEYVVELAERWLKGEMPEGFYSASY